MTHAFLQPFLTSDTVIFVLQNNQLLTVLMTATQ